MRKLFQTTTLALSLAVLAAPTLTFAEKSAKPRYSFGTVKEVFENRLIVNEYDIDKAQNVDFTYTISSKVILDGVDTLSEIAAGDNVDVLSLARGEEEVVDLIVVEKGIADVQSEQ